MKFQIVFLAGMLLLPNVLQAQTGEENWGIWYMYFGQYSVNEKWSVHTELQHRNYEIPGHFNQLLTRLGINYHHSSGAIFTTGVGYIRTVPFTKTNSNMGTNEFRIWQELRLANRVGRVRIGHRYRFEERWVSGNDMTNFLLRARYRINASLPLNDPEMGPGTFSLETYDEIFINLSDTPFSQNRLYGALGYKVSKNMSVQLGYLYNRIGALDFSRLQIGFFFST